MLDVGTDLVICSGPWGWGSGHTVFPSLPKAVRNSRSSYGGRTGQPEGFDKPLFCQGVSLVAVQNLCWYLYLWSLCCVLWFSISSRGALSSQRSLWGWYTVSGNDSCSCCMAHLLLSRCKIKHMLLMLSWPRLMLLFPGFMSEAQKTWKSLMEKTYEIIPSTHRVVPCKIFSIILSKAIKTHSSERDPNTSPGELLHLPGCQGGLIYPQSTVQS